MLLLLFYQCHVNGESLEKGLYFKCLNKPPSPEIPNFEQMVILSDAQKKSPPLIIYNHWPFRSEAHSIILFVLKLSKRVGLYGHPEYEYEIRVYTIFNLQDLLWVDNFDFAGSTVESVLGSDAGSPELPQECAETRLLVPRPCVLQITTKLILKLLW